MRLFRRILFSICIPALAGLWLSSVSASTTKVGNGDDGSDLESLSPITSGPIWNARRRAYEHLKSLNVSGAPGLGLLIPELERADLLMATKDVHPTGETTGSIEISGDRHVVYARTFAEPYAATRFFPAALTLNSEQLVALHIHEALHRSLPIDLRTNENVVMHLTMAMTSPGASFDRVRQVSGLYLTAPHISETSPPSPSAGVAASTYQISLPPRSRTSIEYEFSSYSLRKVTAADRELLHGVGFTTSLGGFKTFKAYLIEPVFRARIKLVPGIARNSIVGPSNYEFRGRLKLDDGTTTGLFGRVTVKSLDESAFVKGDRDIATFGVFYQAENEWSFISSELFYSPASKSEIRGGSTNYGSIYSLTGRSGYKWGRFNIGGIAELHASEGKQMSDFSFFDGPDGAEVRSAESFRILVAGPEFSFTSNRFSARAYAKWIVNDTRARLDDLGDVMDRGAGRGGFGTALTLQF